jgi:hypothetical protein
VEYEQPYGFSCSRSVPIHFKPLLGIVTRKDFFFFMTIIVNPTTIIFPIKICSLIIFVLGASYNTPHELFVVFPRLECANVVKSFAMFPHIFWSESLGWAVIPSSLITRGGSHMIKKSSSAALAGKA